MVDLTRVLIFTVALLNTLVAPAQERFSFFQPSTLESVERMLKLANLRGVDVIVDFDLPEGSRRKPPWRAAPKEALEYFAPTEVIMP